MAKSTCTVDGCDREKKGSRHFCALHAKRLWATGTTDARKVPSQLERFWSSVDKTGSCWLWTGSKDPLGYGRLRFDGTSKLAHRVAFKIVKGDYPKTGLDHACRVKSCVNPDHLRPANQKQNMEHRSGANRNSKSGVRGVSWVSRLSKWRVDVKHHGKGYYAYFADLDEAAAYAVELRDRLFTHNDDDHALEAARN